MQVKICGLTDPDTVEAALEAGADFLGFVFFPKSARYVSLETATALAEQAKGRAASVALTVDADDALIDAIAAAPIDILQLHGGESPARAAAIRDRTGKKVMKAIGVASAEDVRRITEYEDVVDYVMVDAKPAPGGEIPGGNGVAFDWRLLTGRSWRGPWMLAGGLTAETVAEAGRLTGAPVADVSSGVETAPGVKDAAKIRAFVAAARAG